MAKTSTEKELGYHPAILEAIEYFMDQDLSKSNLILELLKDKQPKDTETSISLGSKIILLKYTFFNPMRITSISALYLDPEQYNTPALQDALLKSKATKRFIKRLAENPKIRESLSDAGGILFKKGGLLDQDGIDTLTKSLSNDDIAANLEETLSEYINPKLPPPLGPIELISLILNDVVNKDDGNLKPYLDRKSSIITKMSQDYVSTRINKETDQQTKWQSMKGAKTNDKSQFLQDIVGIPNSEINDYIRHHKDLPAFKDTLKIYGLDSNTTNKVLELLPGLLKQTENTGEILNSINAEKPLLETISKILKTVNQDDSLKQQLDLKGPMIAKIVQNYISETIKSEAELQIKWDSMKNATNQEKTAFLKENVGIPDSEINAYTKQHSALPSLKDTLNEYSLDPKTTNELVADFLPGLLKQTKNTENIINSINAGKPGSEIAQLVVTMIKENPKLINNNLKTINGIIDKKFTNYLVKESIKSFLKNPSNLNTTLIMVDNVILPAVRTSNNLQKKQSSASKYLTNTLRNKLKFFIPQKNTQSSKHTHTLNVSKQNNKDTISRG